MKRILRISLYLLAIIIGLIVLRDLRTNPAPVTTSTPNQEISTQEKPTNVPVDDAIETKTETNAESFDYSMVPETDGITPYAEINNNEPFFSEEDKTRVDPFEEYSPLDSLGRCGVAYANICKKLMPTEKRESISSVKPSGWKSVKYDIVDGKYLYNRSHLIGFQLAGENANKLNLITGTRYFNVTGMLVFEDQVDDYVDETNNHVLYRVTPVFIGNELVARGVLIEAYSVEDNGELEFCVFCYNIQPGIEIDYATGESKLEDK